MELYIARHGETLSNVEMRLTGGKSNSPLTESGIEQAKQLGKLLEDVAFDAVYSSPLKRAVDTVNIAFGSKYKICTDERLEEIHLGIMEGMKYVEASAKFPDSGMLFYTEPALYKPPEGGESLNDMIKRFNSFINYLKDKNYNKVFALTHGYALRVLYACMIDGRVETIGKAPHYSNCALAHYIYDNNKWELNVKPAVV
ncbi:MAG: histidine phosphatase family protein [Oscillospiraceae bacterium]|jgi:probable phosphoglycerate mutase|nr:histidine phosphatase family protein [Oscillospiraceae bacterium]